MAEQAEQLRELLRRPGIVRMAGAHNALGAKLAERAGFDAVWSSGLEISASHAVPDADILTMSDFLDAAQSMTGAVRIPVVADCDTGFGNSNNVIHMVRRFEAAGVAAVCIEDKLFPKVNSFVPGRQDLAPVAEFAGKIMAAKNAQRSSAFMVIARTEALIAGWGQDEALKRAHAYVEAGADAILIHSKSQTADPVFEFLGAWQNRAPVVVVPTTYYPVTARELEAAGVKAVIYANHGLRAAIRAVYDAFTDILRTGSTASIEDRIAPMSLVFELQGFPEFKRDEQAFLRTGTKYTRAIVPAAGDHLNEYSMRNIAADIPMAALDVNGKPLLQRQTDALNTAGIRDITVVGGYKKEKIEVQGIKLAANEEWQQTGEMHSILCADGAADTHTLIAYSDILFDAELIEKLLKSDAEITLLVDSGFDSKSYAGSRSVDLVRLAVPRPEKRRTLSANGANRVVQIGKRISPEQAHAEFAGLALFSPRGLALLRQVYHRALQDPDRPFHEAASPRRASLTDCVQELIDAGHEICCYEITSGWMEIHSFEDYRLACQLVAR